jgi:IS30 family transposase
MLPSHSPDPLVRSSPEPPVPSPRKAKSSGRPRALDDTKRREICALISAGCSMERAATYVGCAATTIRREATRNPEFNDKLRRASLSAEISILTSIRQAAQKNWRAGAWLLERVDVQRYGRKNARQVNPEQLADYVKMLVDIIWEEIPSEEIRRRIDARMNEAATRLSEEVTASLDVPKKKPGRKKRDYQYQPWRPSAANH